MLKRFEFTLLLIGLLLTGALTWLSANTSTTTAQTAFEHLTEDDVSRLERRLDKYLQALIATAAFLQSDETIDHFGFDQFVTDLDINTTLPGINGIGMIQAIDAADIPALESAVHTEGYADFAVYPPTSGPQKFVITRISPMSGNAAALGLDISFEQGRREAAMQSRIVQAARLTASIKLVQDEKQEAGFLLLLPLDAPGTADWVYAPFVARDLLGYDGLSPRTPKPYVMKVYDATVPSPETLMYDSTSRSTRQTQIDNPVTGTYKVDTAFEHFGRQWTLAFESTESFDIPYRDYSPWGIAIFGTLLTAMLVNVMRNMRLRNTALAEVTTLRDRQIKAQEQENRSIIENAVTPFFILNGVDCILFANQAAHACFGYPLAALHGAKFSEVVHSPAADKSHSTGTTKAGDTLILDLQRNDWVNSHGAHRTTAIVRDITAERLAHRAISSTKTLYDLALQGSEIGVFDLDLETGQTEVSDTWCRIMGQHDLSQPTMNKQDLFLKRVHPDDLDILKKADADCIAGLTDRSICEYRLQTMDGAWRWMKSDAVVSKRAPDGRALHLIGTQTDTTEVRKARDALETSESLFRQILTAAPIGTVILDENAIIVSSNAAFRNLVGVTQGQLDAGLTMYDFVEQRDLDAIYAHMSSLSHAPSSGAYHAEYPVQRITGSDRLGLFHVSRTYNKSTDKTVYIVQIIDVTEQRQVERLKDEFVSAVSHELRTPLTSIKGALSLHNVTHERGDTAGAKRLVEIAINNADRLTAIINDILDLEQISTGTLRFEMQRVDVNSLVTQALTALQPYAATHHNTLKPSLPDAPLMVLADVSRTRQVLENLISNACKYSHAASHIVVNVHPQGDVVCIEVRNTGSGIPEDFQAQLFDAFTQADGSATRHKGGTGLGLHISKQIVRRQGGDIGFQTEPMGLTVFWFTIPMCPNGLPTPECTENAAASPDPARLTVLHIEGDDDFAEVIRTGLAPHAEVIHAPTMDDVQATMQNNTLHAALIDWALPDDNANALLTQLQQLHPGIRLVGLSAEADRASDQRLSANLVKTRADMKAIAKAITPPLATKTPIKTNDAPS